MIGEERVGRGGWCGISADYSKCMGSTLVLDGPGVSESYVAEAWIPAKVSRFASGLRGNERSVRSANI